jgi:predicted NBD/HSP70 family sugar kinase
MIRIGIDLGGTKISGIALDDVGTTRAYERLDTPAGDYQGTLETIARLLSMLEAQTESVHHVGIGTPGALSPGSGMLRNSNSTCLNHKPLKQDLEQLLAKTVIMANDADCFALSEARDGAAKDAQSVFGVILGTGVGGGLVFNGQLLQGVNAIAGEWGHNPLPWMSAQELPGEPCYCGKKGCIETFLSGPGMSRHYELTAGHWLEARRLVELAATEAKAGHYLDVYIDRLSRALAGVINIVDPEVIVLGGGLSNISALYERVPECWGQYVFSDQVITRLVKHHHGDDSGVRGAALLIDSRQ